MSYQGTGSQGTLVGTGSHGAQQFFRIQASDNATVVINGTGIFISATTNAGSSTNTAGLVQSSLTISTTYPLSGGGDLSANRTLFVVTGGAGQVLITSGGVSGGLTWVNTLGGATGSVYAPTGGSYIVFSADTDLTNEKVLTASNNITITTDSTTIWISATTGAAGAGGGSGTVNAGSAGNLTYYASAGTSVDDLLIGSAGTILAVNSSGALHQYFLLRASDNATVVVNGTSFNVSATTANISGKQDLIAIPLTTTSGGTGRTTIGSAHTILGVNSSEASLTYYAVLASNQTTVTKAGTAIFISASTTGLAQSAVTVSAGSGLSGGGDLSANRTFTVNTNVRDKCIGFFFSGNLSTTMLGEEARIYIPFNMELLDCRLAVTTSATGANITVNPRQYNHLLTANTALYTSANRPRVLTNQLVGSENAEALVTTLYVGSYLGVDVDQVGSTVAGSNLTITFCVRTS